MRAAGRSHFAPRIGHPRKRDGASYGNSCLPSQSDLAHPYLSGVRRSSGLSNPDIAQQLVLSEHTVHRHLANILRKLNLLARGGRGLGRAHRAGVSLARSGHPLRPREAGPYGRSGTAALKSNLFRERAGPYDLMCLAGRVCLARKEQVMSVMNVLRKGLPAAAIPVVAGRPRPAWRSHPPRRQPARRPRGPPPLACT